MKLTVKMPRIPLFEIVVAKNFFEKYCTDVKNWKHKLRGIDGNGNPIDFSPEEKKAIKTKVKMIKFTDLI